jgi:zinc/manganese transport system substrate-binding protein
MRVSFPFVIALILVTTSAFAQSRGLPVRIVAAENFYGDVAQQLGGENVTVTSILSNPDQDPHLFEASASTARALAEANFVIYNGIGYDPWVSKLLTASKSESRDVIVVAALMQRQSGDNPHLWYDPATMPTLAKALSAELSASDPYDRAGFERRLASFLASLRPITVKISEIRQKYAGTTVTATEPIFGYMADALGLKMRNDPFQLAVMNDTEPSAGEIASFERDLKTRTVKVLFYNSQTTDDLTARLKKLARDAHVPVVGVTETEPPGKSYQDWMMQQLDATEQALSNGSS